MKKLFLPVLVLCMGCTSVAYADCTSPPGVAGTMDYFTAPDNSFKFCNGTEWVSMSGGAGAIPGGMVAAFDLTVCPPGWSEYTQARGRFLRGIDNGAGNDPGGTRPPGHVQADAFKSHTHDVLLSNDPNAGSGGGVARANNNTAGGASANKAAAEGGDETRPKNVAVLFCRKT